MSKLKIWVACFAVVWAWAWASPAQNLFNEATRLLVQQYGGFSKLSLADLKAKYQTQLDQACQGNEACPTDQAATVLRALIGELDDSHTRFFSPAEYADLQRRLRGSTSERPQLGVILEPVEDMEGVLIVEVMADSPAQEAGLRRGDRILSVEGKGFPSKAEERVPFLREFVGKGQPIKLEVLRINQTLEVQASPRIISLQQLPSLNIRPDGVGVLRIPSFNGYMQVGPKIHELVKQAQQQGAKALVVDLRNNGGGLVSECLVGAGAFVQETFRRLHQPNGDSDQGFHNDTFYTKHGNEEFGLFKVTQAQWDQPVAVLVNERTASCAEYFAFDLQEGRGAPVFGAKTAGVGNTATIILQLSDGSGIQITTSQAERRDGSPYPEFVTPTVLVDNDWKAFALGRDVILERAVDLLNNAAVQTR